MEFPKHPFIREMGGYVVDVARYASLDSTAWSLTNPSIGHNGKSVYAMTFRSSNYVISKINTYDVTEGSKIRNKVYFSELTSEFKIRNLRQVDFDGLETEEPFRRGVEDAKLFWRDGSWWFTAVALEEDWITKARMALFKFNSRSNKVESFELLPGFNRSTPEKNWMANPTFGSFDYVYGANKVVVGEVLQAWMTDSPELDNLRGSSNLLPLDDDSFLGVMHRTTFYKTNPYNPKTFSSVGVDVRNYIHYFVKFNKEGYITAISQGFQFFQPGVEFANGIVAKGNEFLVSFGKRDVSSHIAVIPKSVVFDSLETFEY